MCKDCKRRPAQIQSMGRCWVCSMVVHAKSWDGPNFYHCFHGRLSREEIQDFRRGLSPIGLKVAYNERRMKIQVYRPK